MGLEILEIYFLGPLVCTSLSQNILSPPPQKLGPNPMHLTVNTMEEPITSGKPEKVNSILILRTASWT